MTRVPGRRFCEIRRRKSNVNQTKGGVSFGQVIIELEGFARGFFRFAPTFDWGHGAIVSEIGVGIRQARMSQGIIPVFLQRFFEIINRRT